MASTSLNFFKKVKFSITNFGFYKNVLKESIDNAFTYLFLLALLMSVLVMIKPMINITKGFNEMQVYIQKEVTDFSFANGELKMSGKMPVILHKNDSEIFIIDTTGRTNKNILDNYKEGVLITKNKIYNKENQIKIEEYDLSKAGKFKFTKKDLLRWLGKPIIIAIADIFILVFAVTFMILGKFISVFFSSLLGLIIKWIKNIKIEYSDLYKLVIYALTLPIILATLQEISGFKLPYAGLIYNTIFAVYLWKAMDKLTQKR